MEHSKGNSYSTPLAKILDPPLPILYVVYVQAKETRLVVCNNLAERLEESTLKLRTARFEIRDMRRTLNSCSDRLTATTHALNASEVKLKDAIEMLNQTQGGGEREHTKAASNSAVGEDSSCTEQLAEVLPYLKAKKERMLISPQEQEDKLLATTTAEECSLDRKGLRRGVEENVVPLSPDPGKAGLPERKKQRRCNCEDMNAVSDAAESGGDKTTNRQEKVPSLLAEKYANCSRQLTEARAERTTRGKMFRNCSARLAEERENRTKDAATARACSRQLGELRRRLELEAASHSECDARLKDAETNFRAFASDAEERCNAKYDALVFVPLRGVTQPSGAPRHFLRSGPLPSEPSTVELETIQCNILLYNN